MAAESAPRNSLLVASTPIEIKTLGIVQADIVSIIINAWCLEFCRRAHVATLECHW